MAAEVSSRIEEKNGRCPGRWTTNGTANHQEASFQSHPGGRVSSRVDASVYYVNCRSDAVGRWHRAQLGGVITCRRWVSLVDSRQTLAWLTAD